MNTLVVTHNFVNLLHVALNWNHTHDKLNDRRPNKKMFVILDVREIQSDDGFLSAVL